MCLLFFSSCTVSPRYSSSNQSIKSGKLEQKKYTARRKDAMQGFKPTEFGPNTAQEKLSKGKGTKAKKRMIDLLMKRIPKDK